MNGWVISIGTGSSQLPLIREAKRIGFNILGIDRSPKSNAIDEYIQLSTYDKDAVIDEIERNHKEKKFKAVLARVSGPAICTAAYTSFKLGLPGYSINLARMSVTKSLLRNYAEKIGVPTMEGNSLLKKPKWIEGSDWIIKPDQPVVGKKNVYRVTNKAELERAFSAASNESLNKFVECQAYSPGRDIGIVLAMSFGKLLWHSFYEEIVESKPGNVIGMGHRIPVRGLAENYFKSMVRSSLNFLDKQLATGFFFFSFRCEKNMEPKLYEMNPGLCGDDLADKIFPSFWPGFNFFSIDVSLMLGERPKFPEA